MIRRVISEAVNFFTETSFFLPFFNTIFSWFRIILFSTNCWSNWKIVFLIWIKSAFQTFIGLKNSSRSNFFSRPLTANDFINLTFNRKSCLWFEIKKDLGNWKGYGKQKSSFAANTSILQELPDEFWHSSRESKHNFERSYQKILLR